MINWISSWIQGIIIAVIISTIIEMLLPEGNIKKYVKTVIGIYIVFVIISPIITKITGKEISLKSIKVHETQEVNAKSINTNSYIESTYINKIEQDIIEKVEERGYSVEKVNIQIDNQDLNYGNIVSIDLKLLKGKIKNNKIEPITINANKKEEKEEEFEEGEIKELKAFLNQTYGTKLERISIK